MSDEPKAPGTPLPADAQQSAGQTPGLQKQTTGSPPPAAPTPAPASTGTTPQVQRPPSAPPIDYAMPANKAFIPSPALIRNIGCLIKLIAGFTVLICMGYFALVALNPKARKWALQGTQKGPNGAPPTGKGPTPFNALNQVLAIPAQALGKTDEVVKAGNARAAQVDGLVAEEEKNAKGGKSGRSFAPVTDPFSTPAATDKKKTSAATADGAGAESAESQAVSRAAILALAEKNAATGPQAGDPMLPVPAPKPVPVTPPAPDTPDQIKLAGNVVITHASPAGTPRAAAPFFYWTVKLNVSGITLGPPARLLLNGRLTYEGDVVNRTLGITFVQLDAANQLLVFRDATGATVTRSY